ncbi:MAG: outer membrane lipid asymmetry maintenance protein MlaD [Pseudomonadota bacterium]
MANSAVETGIGALVLTAAAGFLVYAANTADISADTGYALTASFGRAEGVNPGGDVRIAGVKVGTITDMSLDPKRYRAVVTMSIRSGIVIPEDTAAKIASTGLLGDSFIALVPGASEYALEPGDEFEFTQDSVSFLDLAAKAVAGTGVAE